ncbi:serralysin [Bradyrhizobium japonicum]
MANSVTVGATNNADIDGLLSGYKWTGTITYSFPDSASDYSNPYYGGNSEPTSSGFAAAPSAMQTAINYAIGLILGYTNASIQYVGTDGANIMIAQSSKPATSYAYYPGDYAAGGDVWFGTQYDYSLAKLGNYYFATAMHELGHALGLKHSQETGGPANVAVPSAHDDSEYTIMSYRSYVGASTTAGYSNEAYGYPQTYMANDILTLQTMYGANYATQGGNTVYSWNPTTGQEFINGVGQLAPGGGTGSSANRIYETIWDGGGIDTYDLSSYTTNLSINLNPGATSLFSTVQRANLGDNQNLGYDHYASGNVYNAYLYNNDARSYIDNATGGSGNDTIIGNAIANVLNGGGGNDMLTGGGGNDTIIGGAGTDTAVYSGNRANYGISYNSATQTLTLVDERAGSPDGIDMLAGLENFQFADGTVTSATLLSQLGPVALESFGSTTLLQVGSNYELGNAGPMLKYNGSMVTAGQFAPWVPIGAEHTASGFDFAWKMPGTDNYTVWSTDANGNYTGNLTEIVSGGSSALESLETVFHQDLNGDGTIGVPSVTVESFGSTALLQVGSNYELGNAGPMLKYNGSMVTAGQFAPWVPIGAEHTASGFDFAWKMPGTDNYTVWSTDANGNYTGNLTEIVSGGSSALESLETVFHQDLNGDGTIGVPSVTVESFGSTALLQVGSNYELGNAGPMLKYNGSMVTAGQFAPWVPIGAEHTASGFDFAWKMPGTDNYTVWSTDANGNYTGNLTEIVSGGSSALESLETVFHQDLNGDGTIGVPSVTVESFGSTALLQVGSNYELGNAGPMLKYNGSMVTAGQFAPWVPIGAEHTASGFDFAWKMPGTDNYTVWSTDANGNYTGNLTEIVSGGSSALESLETVFHQDLNGDGTIGVPSVTVESFGSTALLQVGSNYELGNAGPMLKYNGSMVTAGQFAPWVPIGAEHTASGFDFAWKMPGTDNYTVWSTDANGNYTGNLTEIVSGGSSALESLETVFHQDLNGDGIGAEHTASGFDFAWKTPGEDNYTVWTDANANLTRIVPGISRAPQTLDTTFHGHLPGDGSVGIRAGTTLGPIPSTSNFDGPSWDNSAQVARVSHPTAQSSFPVSDSAIQGWQEAAAQQQAVSLFGEMYEIRLDSHIEGYIIR